MALMTESAILNELKSIKQDLAFIKSHMVDRDEIMTKDEHKMVVEALEEERLGKTVSLASVKKRLGV